MLGLRGCIRARRKLRPAGGVATALDDRVVAVWLAIGGVLAPIASTTSPPTSAASRPLAARTLLPARVAIGWPRRIVATSSVVGARRLIGAGTVVSRSFLARRSVAARSVVAPGCAPRHTSLAWGGIAVWTVAPRIAAGVTRAVAPLAIAPPRPVPATAIAIMIAVPVTATTAAAVSIGSCIARRRSIARRRRRL
jgi:hypothetical protein